MLLVHAQTLTQARSCLAALADGAAERGRLEASSAYERALIDLDALHADKVPALALHELPGDRESLMTDAATAISALADNGADALRVELILASLEDARVLDED